MSITSKVLQSAQKYCLLFQKCIAFYWGRLCINIKVVSKVAKRGNREISLQSRVVFLNNFSKQMFKVGSLRMFEIRIKYNYLEDSLSLSKILTPLIT